MAREEWEDEEYEEETEEEEEEELDVADLITQEKRDLLMEMKTLDKKSPEYMVLAQRLADITECSQNEANAKKAEKEAAQSRYSWLLPTLFQTGGTIVGQVLGQVLNRGTVNDVLKHEDDGNILTTKATGFIQKPR